MRNLVHIKLFMMLSIVLTLIGCGPDLEYELDAKTFDKEHLEKIEKETGITLPQGSRGLNMYYKDLMDPCIIAKIEISSTERDRFYNMMM